MGQHGFRLRLDDFDVSMSPPAPQNLPPIFPQSPSPSPEGSAGKSGSESRLESSADGVLNRPSPPSSGGPFGATPSAPPLFAGASLASLMYSMAQSSSAPTGTATGTTLWTSSAFPSQPQASRTSTETFRNNTLPTSDFQNQAQASSTTTPFNFFTGPQTTSSLFGSSISTSLPQGSRSVFSQASYAPTPFSIEQTPSVPSTFGGCTCNKSPTTAPPSTPTETTFWADSTPIGFPRAQPQASSTSTFPTPNCSTQAQASSAPTFYTGSQCFGPSTTSSLPQGSRVASNGPTLDERLHIKSISVYQNKSHEELRLEAYKTLTNKAREPIQPHTSRAASNGLGPLDLLTSALSTHSSPIVLGFAGQFPPDTLVLCPLQSSTSVVPNGSEPWSKVPSSATSITQTSTPTAFTWPENIAPQKTQDAPDSQVSNGKNPGQSAGGAFKSGIPVTCSLFTSPAPTAFGVTFPPSPAPTVTSSLGFTFPQETQTAPETLVNTNKVPGPSPEALKPTPFGFTCSTTPFGFTSPSLASTSELGISVIPTFNSSGPSVRAFSGCARPF